MEDLKDKTKWKKEIIELLKKYNLITKDFTGKTVLNFNQGSITDIEKTERIK